MKILALDLGTRFGFAYTTGMRGRPGLDLPEWHHKVEILTPPQIGTGMKLPFFAGALSLGSASEISSWHQQRLDRRCDPRMSRFAELLKRIGTRPDLVIFEDVEFSSYTRQTQLWASFRTVVWSVFHDVLIDCVPVSTLKKFATGYGGAIKGMMAQALVRKYPGLRAFMPLDDNAVDAAWLWEWATAHHQ